MDETLRLKLVKEYQRLMNILCHELTTVGVPKVLPDRYIRSEHMVLHVCSNGIKWEGQSTPLIWIYIKNGRWTFFQNEYRFDDFGEDYEYFIKFCKHYDKFFHICTNLIKDLKSFEKKWFKK